MFQDLARELKKLEHDDDDTNCNWYYYICHFYIIIIFVHSLEFFTSAIADGFSTEV